jgi:hypothetical protein
MQEAESGGKAAELKLEQRPVDAVEWGGPPSK